MQAPRAELISYANSLRFCTVNFYTEHRRAARLNRDVNHVPNTMSNILSTANQMETWLERHPAKGGVDLRPLIDFMSSGTVFDALVLFTPQAHEDALVQSQDFTDRREVPHGYTLGQYMSERLPRLAELMPQLRSPEVQNERVRPVLIDLVTKECDSLKNLANEESDTLARRAARDELSIFENLRQRLTQRITVAPDTSTK